MGTSNYDPILEAIEEAPIIEEDLPPEELAEVEQRTADLGSGHVVGIPHADVEEAVVAWSEEIVQRVRDLREGRSRTIPALDAFAHARARVRSVRG